jgi:glutathione S-transferase
MLRRHLSIEDAVMLKIWGRKNSSNVRKALWCAEELGLVYQAIDAGGAFGVVDTPEYRAKNPNGRVPMIEDDGFVLWESNTIVRYLAARHASGSAWYPADVQARAQAEKWMDWTTSSFAAPFRTVFWGVLRTPAEQQDWAAINAAIKECDDLLAMVERTLSEQPYLSGDEIGMGDIPLGSFIYAWFEMPIQRAELPGVGAWYARLQQRPAYRKAVMTALT